MARVIEQGFIKYKHALCGSLIEFSYSELAKDFTTDYLGDRDYFRSLTCPSCGETIRFPEFGPINGY